MSGLFGFLITFIVLCAVGYIFFLVIDRAAPDPTMNKVAKAAVGTVFTVVILQSVYGLLFGGGASTASPGGIISFAIGAIICLVVLYILDAFIGKIAEWVGATIAGIIKVVVFAIVLCALLVLVDQTLMGGRYTHELTSGLGPTPQIMKPERR